MNTFYDANTRKRANGLMNSRNSRNWGLVNEWCESHKRAESKLLVIGTNPCHLGKGSLRFGWGNIRV